MKKDDRDEERAEALCGRIFRPGHREELRKCAGRAEGMQRESDAANDVGEVQPNFCAAEMRTFGANGRCDAGADVARRANVFCESGMNAAEFSDFIHGSRVDFFLSIEAGAHGPLV